MPDAVLNISGLRVAYLTERGARLPVLDGLNLVVRDGEAVGICGESGAGKTTFAHAILRLLPRSRGEIAGKLRFRGEDLLGMPPRRLQEVRGRLIGMVPQEPSIALNPVRDAVSQVTEVLYAHRPLTWTAAKDEAISWLARFFPGDEHRVARSYPHQLSGGERQRVVLAQAVCCSPVLLIADEPASTLDSITRFDVLQLLKRLCAEHRMSLVFVSHDRAALKFLTGRILELRDGRLWD